MPIFLLGKFVGVLISYQIYGCPVTLLFVMQDHEFILRSQGGIEPETKQSMSQAHVTQAININSG